MTKIFLIIFIAVLATASYGQQLAFVKDSVMTGYMESGFSNKHFQPQGKQDKNGLRQGEWKDYEVSNGFAYVSIGGKPKQIFGYFLRYGEGKFVDGLREGPWTLYLIEDKTFKKIKQQEVLYVKGKMTGPFKYYLASGKLGMEGTYAADQYDGELKSYYENGKPYGTRYYINGLRTGRHTYFHPDGKLRLEHSFLRDTLNGLYRTVYPNGHNQETFEYVMGKENGIYRYYYENGQLWIEKEYRNGLLMNVNVSYDEKGKPRNQGTIKNGNGTVNYYTEDGRIYMIHTLKDGVVVKEESR